jgi:hypothetical protein
MDGRWITQRCRSDGGGAGQRATHPHPLRPAPSYNGNKPRAHERNLLPPSASFPPSASSPRFSSRAPHARSGGGAGGGARNPPRPPGVVAVAIPPPPRRSGAPPPPLTPSPLREASNAVCRRVGSGGCEGGCWVLRNSGREGGAAFGRLFGGRSGERGCSRSRGRRWVRSPSDSCFFDVLFVKFPGCVVFYVHRRWCPMSIAVLGC